MLPMSLTLKCTHTLNFCVLVAKKFEEIQGSTKPPGPKKEKQEKAPKKEKAHQEKQPAAEKPTVS